MICFVCVHLSVRVRGRKIQEHIKVHLKVYFDIAHMHFPGPLQQVELDESPSKDGDCPDETHDHEHAQQDVIQHHGDKLPLLRCLEWDKMRKRESQDGGILTSLLVEFVK